MSVENKTEEQAVSMLEWIWGCILMVLGVMLALGMFLFHLGIALGLFFLGFIVLKFMWTAVFG